MLGWGNCVLFDEMGDEAEKLGGLEQVEQGEGAKVSVVNDMQGEFLVTLLLNFVRVRYSFFCCFSRSAESLERYLH